MLSKESEKSSLGTTAAYSSSLWLLTLSFHSIYSLLSNNETTENDRWMEIIQQFQQSRVHTR